MALRPLDYAMGVAVPLTWGLGIVFAKTAIDAFPPVLLMALRFLLTALVLLWALRPTGGQLKRLFLIAAIGAALQYSLTFNGVAGLDASVASLVVQLEAPFLVLLGALFLGERPTGRKWLGVAVAFGGVALIAGAPKLDGAWGPLWLVVGGAFTWAVGQAMVRGLRAVDGWTVTAWVAVFATPQLFLISLATEPDPFAAIAGADAAIWATVIYLGVVMTAGGYGMWNALIRRHPIGDVAPFLLLLPVFGVLGAVLIRGEAPSERVLLGGVVVLFGLALIFFERRPDQAMLENASASTKRLSGSSNRADGP